MNTPIRSLIKTDVPNQELMYKKNSKLKHPIRRKRGKRFCTMILIIEYINYYKL